MSQIDEIKSRIDIIDLIGESVKLRRSGRNYAGLCPFHGEKTPSFMVSPERQTWRCFGQCNEGGDIFSFIMKKEGWDFGETLRYLAQKAGVQLEEYRAQKPEEKEEHERLRQALEDAATFYRHHLLNTDEGKTALEYLRQKRHISDTTLETFGLGYAPRGWDNLLRHLTASGYNEQDLVDSGLVTARAEDRDTETKEHKKLFDRFRERIMIPIRDATGKMAGFGARILNPDDFPKFLNSPETPLFSKSRILYGFDRARKAIRLANQAVIVEGYLDVIALHQAGFENVVSPMGTALTEDQLRLLKRATRRIVLALDPDAAGQKAVLSGLEAARQALDRETESGFDARGLLRHEARLQADLRVATMPDELDPDEIVQRDPDQWKQLIEQAQPIVVHVMGALAAGRDLEDAKVKSEIAAQVLPLIEDIPNPVERDTYRQRLARFLKVDERALASGQARGPKTRRARPTAEEIPPRREAAAGSKPAISPAHKVEAHLLGLLLRRPDLLYRLDRALQENSLGRMSPEDFVVTDHQALFRLVRESLEQDSADPDRYLLDHLPAPLAGPMSALLEGAAELDLDDRLLEDLFRSALAMRRRIVDDNISQLRYLIEEDQLMAEPYHQMVMQHTRTRQLLDRARLTQNGHK
ncbi:MAG: DNA primase [Chloroflexi bacterium]|nr:DNA primase [Chloroflexota bacterium]